MSIETEHVPQIERQVTTSFIHAPETITTVQAMLEYVVKQAGEQSRRYWNIDPADYHAVLVARARFVMQRAIDLGNWEPEDPETLLGETNDI
jgi:hypothetical protein